MVKRTHKHYTGIYTYKIGHSSRSSSIQRSKTTADQIKQKKGKKENKKKRN